jgi:hypothetical protein
MSTLRRKLTMVQRQVITLRTALREELVDITATV